MRCQQLSQTTGRTCTFSYKYDCPSVSVSGISISPVSAQDLIKTGAWEEELYVEPGLFFKEGAFKVMSVRKLKMQSGKGPYISLRSSMTGPQRTDRSTTSQQDLSNQYRGILPAFPVGCWRRLASLLYSIVFSYRWLLPGFRTRRILCNEVLL